VSDTDLLQQLLVKLEDVSELHIGIIQLSSKVDQLILSTQKLERTLHGNGRPGLVKDFEDLRREVDLHPKTCPRSETINLLASAHARDEEERKAKADHEKEDLQERRKLRNSFLVSVVLLLISTTIHVILTVRGLK